MTAFNLQWQTMLTDYITAIAWSPNLSSLAAASAAGDVLFWPDCKDSTPIALLSSQERTIEGLAFSYDGQFLAAAGQAGTVYLWRTQDVTQPALTLDASGQWIEQLAWSPTANLFAFSVGKAVQVWDLDRGVKVATLAFDRSSVLDLHWHPKGEYLAIAGYRGARIWAVNNWQQEAPALEIASATLALRWSPDGQYLAAGNFDRTITVLPWGERDPWLMRGFPGKVRKLAWSIPAMAGEAPVLASVSAEGVVLWEREAEGGWAGDVVDLHEGTVLDLAFHPHWPMLASAGQDGVVRLWTPLDGAIAPLAGAAQGLTHLAWQPTGDRLAAGGQAGELLVWAINDALLDS
ncbi:WD40 repeat domain-containing protein [Alkalinema pantanalense CENA528]|uniref:WD40 repeat domain-containing protein n=1 Tax=Alkalinema pantanalense TaxID=1620705 RepID=UPI003D6FA6BC